MKPKTEIAHITTPVAKYTLDFNTGVIKAKPIITHGDSIRSMTDEELAEFMNCGACPPGKDVSELCYDEDGGSVPDMCNLCWLDWLKQEVPNE